jgi:hypothetical protein
MTPTYLFDVHVHQHGDTSMVPTYIRGSKRLDYCLLSPELAPFVVASGINRFSQCYHSDHRALFLDINLAAYLGASLPKLARPDQRFVSSSSRHVTKFISTIYAHLQENKTFHKFQEYLFNADVSPCSLGAKQMPLPNSLARPSPSENKNVPPHPDIHGLKTYTRQAKKFGTGKHSSRKNQPESTRAPSSKSSPPKSGPTAHPTPPPTGMYCGKSKSQRNEH